MTEAGVGAETDLKAAGAAALPDGRRGLRLKGWHIESSNRPILGSIALRELEESLGTSHLPEMVFGDSSLLLIHLETGVKIHFNTLDALKGWKRESLPPVEVPAAAKWKFKRDPFHQVVLDYDYTFTTPYCGSETIEPNPEKPVSENQGRVDWEECNEQIDMAALSSKEPILFYDEVVLYEDELADNGVSLLTVKVRVMPSCWFLLLRFWLRVDGVLMRLRDTRVYCAFANDPKAKPVILRESCWREATIKSLSAKGYPPDPSAYLDPNLISQKLPVVSHKTQKLNVSWLVPDFLEVKTWRMCAEKHENKNIKSSEKGVILGSSRSWRNDTLLSVKAFTGSQHDLGGLKIDNSYGER